MSDENPIDAEFVRALAEIIRDNDLAEIDIKTEAGRIRLSKAEAFVAPAAATSMPAMPMAVSAPAPAPAAASESQSAGTSPAPMPTPGGKGDLVPSPMVGTAYLSPSPGAEPFVKEGQQVKEGDTLLIIEAMKVMNQIPAPRSGTIVEIMCEDGQPVEFDQPLVTIE